MPAIERVLLYVGAPKTGTTSVQAFLRDNRDALMARGVYSPMAGRGGIGQHIELPTIIPSRRRRTALDRHANVRDDDVAGRRDRFLAELTSELAGVGDVHTLLLFSEYLFSAERPEARAYRALFGGVADRFESLMYLRRQDQWLASLTLQARKTGGRHDLELSPGSPRNYAESVRAWEAHSDRCHIGRLDPAFMAEGKLLEDFCRIVGVPTEGLDMTGVHANPAILQEQVELVDALNRRIERLRFQMQILHRSRFVLLCTEIVGGTRIAFRREAAERAFEGFKGINRWLRETRDPAGPEWFFSLDFSGYEESPDNSRRYSEEQIHLLLAEITGAMEARGMHSPGDPPRASREALVDHLITAYVSLRNAELEERRLVRIAKAAEAGRTPSRKGHRRTGGDQSPDERPDASLNGSLGENDAPL